MYLCYLASSQVPATFRRIHCGCRHWIHVPHLLPTGRHQRPSSPSHWMHRRRGPAHWILAEHAARALDGHGEGTVLELARLPHRRATRSSRRIVSQPSRRVIVPCRVTAGLPRRLATSSPRPLLLREREAPTGGERGWVLFYEGAPGGRGGQGRGSRVGETRVGRAGDRGVGARVGAWVLRMGEAWLWVLRRGRGCEMRDCNPKFIYLYCRWLPGLAWASWTSFFSETGLIKDRLV